MANGEQQWATGVLRKLGVQPTQRSVSNLIGWAKAEGGHTNGARYNWLNTTQNMPGAGNTGTQGNIKVYKSLQQGIDATAKTLENGHYGSIVSSLDGSPQQLASAISSSPWGTHNPALAQIIASGKGSPAGSYGSGSSRSPQVDTSQGTTALAAAAPTDNKAALQQYLLTSKSDPNALLNLAAATQGGAAGGTDTITPEGTTTTSAAPGAKASSQGAAAALDWVSSKLGDPNSRETGTNTGGLSSYANKQFGMSNQPWCAMFTSLAVTKGGAPASARTASVAAVRQKARAKQGYKGFVNPRQAKPGDLVLFGNSHIAMVQSVDGSTIRYIGGNQADNVTEGTTSVGAVDVVRPDYQ